LPLFVILWGLYSCSGINKNVDLDVENIFRISDDIRSFYSDKADYWGLSTDFVTDNKIIENKFIRNKKIVIGANKELFVGRGSNAEKIMPGTKVFDVVLKKLNKKQCVSFLEATISPSNQVKLLSISVENTDKTKVFEWGNDKINLPITKGIGEEFCTDSNTIIWTIK
ncbi:MAG: hypothetical protein IKW39_03515, partial [Alphaproteobacteria bacterium]|nr:hypothetical protein [Alphaproteobacteria bacterium]